MAGNQIFFSKGKSSVLEHILGGQQWASFHFSARELWPPCARKVLCAWPCAGAGPGTVWMS